MKILRYLWGLQGANRLWSAVDSGLLTDRRSRTRCKSGAALTRLKMATRSLASVCLAASLLSTLPSSAGASEPVKSLYELRTDAVIVQKFDLSCGAAALATLLNFQFGDHVTEKEVTAGLILAQGIH